MENINTNVVKVGYSKLLYGIIFIFQVFFNIVIILGIVSIILPHDRVGEMNAWAIYIPFSLIFLLFFELIGVYYSGEKIKEYIKKNQEIPKPVRILKTISKPRIVLFYFLFLFGVVRFLMGIFVK